MTSETPQGTWLGGAWKGSLWLCYAGSLAGRQKSGNSGSGQRPKPTPRERKSWVFLLAKAAPAYLPTAFSVALRLLFPFLQARCVQVFLLKHALF